MSLPDLERSGKLRSKPSLNELTEGNSFQGLSPRAKDAETSSA